MNKLSDVDKLDGNHEKIILEINLDIENEHL